MTVREMLEFACITVLAAAGTMLLALTVWITGGICLAVSALWLGKLYRSLR